MKKRMFAVPAVLLVLLLFAPSFPAFAMVPPLINYQGELRDNIGTPLEGTYTMHFYLYDDLTAGIQLWNEQQDVTATNGIINVQLGADTPFTGSEFTGNRPVYLEVAIINENTHALETLSPRQQLTATPFAMQAANAELLNGMDETAFASVTHDHDFADLTGKAADSQIPDTITVNQAANADTVDGAHAAAFAASTHGHNFSELTGAATDAQVPDTITVNQAVNADTVDGQHAAAFAAAGHNHDSAYVNEGQTGSINSAMISDESITSNDIRSNTISEDKIVPDIVSSLDGVTNDGGNIDLVAGSNVTITPNDITNTITISAASGGVTDHGALSGLADDDHPQYLTQNEGDTRYVNGSGDTMSGALTVTGSLYADTDLRIGTNDSADNDFLFMDSGTSKYFSWQDAQDTFYANDDLAILGVLQAGNSIDNPGYNRLGLGTATLAEITDYNDLLVTDSLEVGGKAMVHGNLYTYGHIFVGTDSETDDDHIWLDGGSETFYWDDSEDRFRLSDDLWVQGNIEATSNVITGWDVIAGGYVTAAGSVQANGHVEALGDVRAGDDVVALDQFMYSAAKTFTLMIPAVAFHPGSHTTEYDTYGASFRNFDLASFIAPLQLPQGAIVQSVTFYFYNNTYGAVTVNEIRAYLLRHNVNDVANIGPGSFLGENDLFCDGTYTPGSSGDIQLLAAPCSPVTIYNTENQYALYISFDLSSKAYDARFYGARVEYLLQTLQP